MGLIHGCLKAVSRLLKSESWIRERPGIALIVANRSGLLTDRRIRQFEDMLVSAAGERRAKLVCVSGRRAREATAEDAPNPAEIRLFGAARVLIVTILELSAELAADSAADPECFRVDAALCVGSRLVNGFTGSTLETRTHALCRRTRPFVPATAIGGDVIEGLLDQMAESIVGDDAMMRLAA